MKFLKYTNIVGLDVRPGKLRLIQQQKRIARDLPQSLFSNGKIDDFKALTQALKPLVKELGLENCPAAIHLPIQLVYNNCFVLPVGMNEKAIVGQIRQELAREFPELNNELTFDYRKERTSPTYWTIHYLATRAAYLNHYIECVQASGLAVKIVDIDMLALLRACHLQRTDSAAIMIRDEARRGLILPTDGMLPQCRFWDGASEQTILDTLPACPQQLYQYDLHDDDIALGLSMREVSRW